MTIRDYAQIINEMCPVKLFLNDILVWDDFNNDPLEWYYDFLSKDLLVEKLVCEVVHFHHTEIHIYTV